MFWMAIQALLSAMFLIGGISKLAGAKSQVARFEKFAMPDGARYTVGAGTGGREQAVAMTQEMTRQNFFFGAKSPEELDSAGFY
jgi:hypothetical protein